MFESKTETANVAEALDILYYDLPRTFVNLMPIAGNCSPVFHFRDFFYNAKNYIENTHFFTPFHHCSIIIKLHIIEIIGVLTIIYCNNRIAVIL